MTNDKNVITEQINAILARFDLGMNDVSYCNSYLIPRLKRNGRGYIYEAEYIMFFQKEWDSDRTILHIRGLELVSGDKGAELTKCPQGLTIDLQRATGHDSKRSQYTRLSETIRVVDSWDTLKGIPRAQSASVLKWARSVEDIFNTKFPV